MNWLSIPWLELAIAAPLFGAAAITRVRDPQRARNISIVIASIALALSIVAWAVYLSPGDPASGGDWLGRMLGPSFFVVDALNAPLFPLAALIYLLTIVATLRTKIRRFSFSWTLFKEAVILATLACKEPWGIITLLAIGVVPLYFELKSRHKPTRVYVVHMALFVALLVFGWSIIEIEGRTGSHSLLGVLPLLFAVLIRSGIFPVHAWITDLFEHASFGSALVFVTPMIGAYAAVRLVVPIAPDWVLRSMGVLSLFTAFYAAGMSLVQRDARRFFCYIFLSHSSLVFVGLETATPIGLTGALCVWLSIGLALAGFGLVLRALEARHGRISLVDFHGLYEHTPTLAVLFLLTGLASIGFPGTFGFLGTELLVDGAVQAYPYVGVCIVLVSALNGISVVQAYFRLFTGRRHVSSVPLQMGRREWFAVLTLAALILGGGLYPQPAVESRHHAAMELLQQRTAGADGHIADPALHAQHDGTKSDDSHPGPSGHARDARLQAEVEHTTKLWLE